MKKISLYNHRSFWFISILCFVTMLIIDKVPAMALTEVPFSQKYKNWRLVYSEMPKDNLDVEMKIVLKGKTATSTVATSAKDGKMDSANRFGIEFIKNNESDSLFTFMYGWGLHYNHLENPGKIEINSGLFNTHLGLGIALNKMFHFELLPFGGIGVGGATLEVEDILKKYVPNPTQISAGSELGLFWEAGIKAGAYFTYKVFQLGVHYGYSQYNQDLTFKNALTEDLKSSYELESDQIEMSIKSTGTFYGFSIGARF